jgi:hypothetical protein
MPPLPRILNIPLPAYPRMARQAAPPEPLTPEEESGLLSRTLGGLSYIAETLDKPGAAARGLLAGQPGQLLNLIPFSDALGITDPQDRVYGRDLLEKAGLLGPNTEGFDWGDVAGLGVEILTDPLNMLVGPGKAVTQQGLKHYGELTKAIEGLTGVAKTKAAREMAETAIETVGKGVGNVPVSSPLAYGQDILEGRRGLLGLSLPWPLPGSSKPYGDWAVLGKGSKTAADILGAMGYGKYAGVPLRTVRYLFDPAVKGAAPWGTVAGDVYKAADFAHLHKTNLESAAMDFTATVAEEMRELGKAWQDQLARATELGDEIWTRDLGTISRELIEHTEGLKDAGDGIARIRQAAADLPEHFPRDAFQDFLAAEDTARRYHALLESTLSVKDELYNKLNDLGLDGDEMVDAFIYNHFPRYADPMALSKADRKAGLHLFDTFFGSKIGRRIRDVPGGTLTIERAVTDPLIHGYSKEIDKAGKYIKLPEVERLKALKEYASANGLKPAKENVAGYRRVALLHKHFLPGTNRSGRSINELEVVEKADEFLQWMGGLPSHTYHAGVFNRGTMRDMARYLESGANVYGSLATIHHLIRKHPGLKHITSGEPAEGMVSIQDLLMQTATTKEGPRARRLISDRGVKKLTRDWATENSVEYSDDLAAQLFVPESTRGVLAAHGEAMQPWTPTVLGEMFDRVTNLWKGAQTVMFPAFHFRNLVSGAYNSAAEGELGFLQIVKEVGRTVNTLRTKGRRGLPYIAEFDTGDVLKLSHGRQIEQVGEAAALTARQLPDEAMPSGGLGFLGEPLWKGWRGGGGYKKLLPWRWRGVVDEVSEGTGKAFIASEMGDRAYALVEFLNRYVPAKLYRDKGFSTAQAAHKVLMTQFDYSKLSPFMRRVGRRAFPFSTWITKNTSYQLSRLFNMPGGMTAQTLRAINAPQRGDEGYVPSFLREGGAIRTGGTEEEAHFIRWLGVPVEEMGRFKFTEGLPDPGRTAGSFGAALHPLFQWPIEAFSGKDLYTGRKVKDMKGLTGIPNMDTMLSAAPWERLRTTTKMMADKRKPGWMRLMDFLTGLKFGTYDVGRWKLLDAQKVQRQILEESPEIAEFTKLYLRDKETASEEIVEQYERSRQLGRLVKTLMEQRDVAKLKKGT